MDSPATEDIQIERSDDVLTVTLNRPQVRNAQTPQMWARFAAIAADIPADVRFVVLAGEGPDFSAGLDRAVFASGMLTELQANVQDFIAQAQSGFTCWTRIPQIVIAQVQGNAIGAGFQLALASDFIVAAPDARFAMREVSIGLVPDLGGTGALIDSIGYRRALSLCATGEFLPATQALDWGLVYAVSADPQARVGELIEQLRGLDAGAVRDVKSLLMAVAHDRDSWSAERTAQMHRLRSLFSGTSR